MSEESLQPLTPLEEAGSALGRYDESEHDSESADNVVVAQTQSEQETIIIIGALADAGIQANAREFGAPALGGFLGVGESRWADILVSPGQSSSARQVLQSYGAEAAEQS